MRSTRSFFVCLIWIFWQQGFLRTLGANFKDHPVMQELERVKVYIRKVNAAEQVPTDRTVHCNVANDRKLGGWSTSCAEDDYAFYTQESDCSESGSVWQRECSISWQLFSKVQGCQTKASCAGNFKWREQCGTKRSLSSQENKIEKRFFQTGIQLANCVATTQKSNQKATGREERLLSVKRLHQKRRWGRIWACSKKWGKLRRDKRKGLNRG